MRARWGRAVPVHLPPNPQRKNEPMDDEDLYDYSNRNAAPVLRRRPAGMFLPMLPQPRVPVQYPTVPAYAQAPAYYQVPAQPQPMVVRQKRILDLPAGEVLAMAAQAFAALQPLPAAPNALGKADDDVSNLIAYQSALAIHAKRDEQLRTVGALVAKLLA